jgi:hypothetical protein
MSKASFSSNDPQIEDNVLAAVKRLAFSRILPAADRTPGYTALASASRTATTSSAAITRPLAARNLMVRLVWTTTDPTLTLTLQVLGSVTSSGTPTNFVVAQTAALSVVSASENNVLVGQGVTNGTGSQTSRFGMFVPTYISIVVTHSNANPITYSLHYSWED